MTEDRHAAGHLIMAALGKGRPVTEADAVVEHMAQCTDARAALVVDGSADQVIADLAAAGWTVYERVDYVAGKRIRFLSPPREGGAPPARQPGEERGI